MAFRRRVALGRAAVAAILGLMALSLGGPEMTIPVLAFVALVYWGHQLIGALRGDEEVAYPALAFVIVVNALVVLTVQVLLFAASIEAF